MGTLKVYTNFGKRDHWISHLKKSLNGGHWRQSRLNKTRAVARGSLREFVHLVYKIFCRSKWEEFERTPSNSPGYSPGFIVCTYMLYIQFLSPTICEWFTSLSAIENHHCPNEFSCSKHRLHKGRNAECMHKHYANARKDTCKYVQINYYFRLLRVHPVVL